MAAQRDAAPDRGMAVAMVSFSPIPLLMIDGESKVIAVSRSFCDAFGRDVALVVGTSLFALHDGNWDLPQVHALFEAAALDDAQIHTCEFDLAPGVPAARSVVVNARKVVLGDDGLTRVRIAVDDVTAARGAAARDHRLAEDNLLLVQEVRHRIANSLQIIASVMMMNARRAASDETREHLRDAHSRLMLVADLQRQLAGAGLLQPNIRAYLKIPGLYPTIASKIVKYGPFKTVADVYAIPDLSAKEKEILKNAESRFVTLDTKPEYVIDKINNGYEYFF